MPLRDQDGNEVEEAEVVFGEPVPVTQIVVRHDEVTFWSEDDQVFSVSRPTHPGAGLSLEWDDTLETL